MKGLCSGSWNGASLTYLFRATAVRAGAAMVIAGLAAEGVTEVENIQYIQRGYENLIEKLTALGADICEIDTPDVPLKKVM